MTERDEPSPVFECVQPEIGGQIWRLTDPDSTAELLEPLRRHLAVCDACRLTLAVGDRLAAAAAEGAVRVEIDDAPAVRPTRRFWQPRLVGGGGLVAVAAGLVLMLMLPPRDLTGRISRGDDAPRFLRPVEGEVVVSASPQLRWTAVDGATGYQIQVLDPDGDYAWSGRSDQETARIPADLPLPAGRDVRVLVSPVPSDLAPMGEISVSFRRGDTFAFLADRFRRAHVASAVVGLAGLVMAFGAMIWARRGA